MTVVVLGGRDEGLAASAVAVWGEGPAVPPVRGEGGGLVPVGVEGTAVVVFGRRGEGLAAEVPARAEGSWLVATVSVLPPLLLLLLLYLFSSSSSNFLR